MNTQLLLVYFVQSVDLIVLAESTDAVVLWFVLVVSDGDIKTVKVGKHGEISITSESEKVGETKKGSVGSCFSNCKMTSLNMVLALSCLMR